MPFFPKIANFFSSPAAIFNDCSKNSYSFWIFFFHLPVIKYITIKGARFHAVLIVYELYAFKCCKLTCQFVTTRTNFLVVFTQISKNRDNFCSDWNFLLKLPIVIVFMLYFHNLGYMWLFF